MAIDEWKPKAKSTSLQQWNFLFFAAVKCQWLFELKGLKKRCYEWKDESFSSLNQGENKDDFSVNTKRP